MSSLTAKKEFYKWVTSLDKSSLSDIDKKFLNLLIINFEAYSSLGTTGGARAKKIGQLIESKNATLSSILPDLSSELSSGSQVFKSIVELKIGPFRGFSSEEIFLLDKKYIFMFGPNGSGKSSFCEGLEYALLGGIEESDVKRIDISTYVKNAQSGNFTYPQIFGLNSEMKKVKIGQNPSVYRFSFIEKNRIDSFARIAATTPNIQKDRIATLFGLDVFSDFVEGFTDNFKDNKYLTLINNKEILFKEENIDIEASKKRIVIINDELLVLGNETTSLIKEVSQEKVKSLDEVRIWLVGEDGTKGIINFLQVKKAVIIADNADISIGELVFNKVMGLRGLLESITLKISELSKFSSELNFKDLYNALKSISKDITSDKAICPACKTPMNKVTINPFDNAFSELIKMDTLATLQSEIEAMAISLSKNTREANDDIKKLNSIKKAIGNVEPSLLLFTEFVFTSIATIYDWKEIFTNELVRTELGLIDYGKLTNEILIYNTSLQLRSTEKEKIDTELRKCQDLKKIYDRIDASQKNLLAEQTKLKKTIAEFDAQNELKIKEIEDIRKKIVTNTKYVDSYQKLIRKLKTYKTQLPLSLSTGLSDKTKEFYNVINAHDPDFEKLERLKLPTSAGEKILIRFKGDEKTHDALLILSEGHIKVLGLSLLLSKVVSEDLGFIIFDDIVNAIDDEHRDGIAELLLNNLDLKNRQHIITCHGDNFINKLEHKLGASVASKEVKSYRFVPTDSIDERGIKISIGDSKHYLLLAKKSLNDDARKDVAFRCRQAIESISEQLWTKLGKKLNVNLTVKMRTPDARPDLASVVDSLIKELHVISGLNELEDSLKLLKEKYPWSLLNKGTHEQSDLPEFERKDVSDLLSLVETIEVKVNEIKLEVSIKCSPQTKE
jgi:recombinational DNA repair ATPase RecF